MERGVWFAVATVGAFLVAVGVFLPVWDKDGSVFSRIEGNSLIQSGGGWAAAAGVLATLIAGAIAFTRRTRTFVPLSTGIVAIMVAVYTAVAEDPRTVCAVVDPSACEVVPAGLGVYAVGLGGLILVAAGISLCRKVVVAGWHSSVGAPSSYEQGGLDEPETADPAMLESGSAAHPVIGQLPHLNDPADSSAPLVVSFLLAPAGLILGVLAMRRHRAQREFNPAAATAYRRGVAAVVVSSALMLVAAVGAVLSAAQIQTVMADLPVETQPQAVPTTPPTSTEPNDESVSDAPPDEEVVNTDPSEGPVFSSVRAVDSGQVITVTADYCDRTPGDVNNFLYAATVAGLGNDTLQTYTLSRSQTRACNTVVFRFEDVFVPGSYGVRVLASNLTNRVDGTGDGFLEIE